MQPPLVSFVIATYGRPDALYATLRALTLQSHTRWEAFVVGDCCPRQTEETIRTVADPRIRYYNLPFRFGEQAGPNTFGLRLVQGEYMCFLNHDDLLLSDHLSAALQTMQQHDADLYFGKYAHAREVTWIDGQPFPDFSDILPAHSDRCRMYEQKSTDLDPSSFWLIRTSFAKAIGPWKLSATLWRTPLSDWLLRAGASNGKVVFGTLITGLRMHTHNAARRQEGTRPVYESTSPEFASLLRLLSQQSAEDIRALITSQVQAKSRVQAALKRFRRGMRATFGLALFKYLHFDMYSWRIKMRGEAKGREISELLKYRTGELLVPGRMDDLACADPEMYRRI